MAATHRIRCYARALVSAGHDCEVAVFRPWEQLPEGSSNQGIYEGVPYRTVLDAEEYVRQTLGKGDVLFLYMGKPLDLMLRLIRAAKDRGAFAVRDLCELPYGTGKESWKTCISRKCLLFRQFPKLDGIVCISDALMDLARRYSGRHTKLIKVPILVDFDSYGIGSFQEAVPPYIFHSGTFLERKDGILGMIEAFGLAVPRLAPGVRYVMAGDLDSSPQKEAVCQLISEYNLGDRVTFTGRLGDSEVRSFLMEASLTILNKHPNSQNMYGFSTKLGEYLASARPVLMTDVGEAMNWLEDGKSAYIARHGDVKALSDGIVKALSNDEERRRIALNGREVAARNFDYKVWGRPLAEFLSSLGK